MKALIITSNNTPLLQKILFEVVKFDPEQITWADPSQPFRLRDEPDVIIPVGQDGLSKLNIDLTSITKDAGKVSEYMGVPVVPVMAPGFIDKNPHLMRKWAEDIHTAYAIMMGIEKLDQTNQKVIVTNAIQLMDLIDNIKKAGYSVFDFETTNLTDLKHHDPNFYCTAISFTFQQGSSYVIPLYHKDSPNSKEFLETCRRELEKEVFLNPDVTKIGHNVKFDMHCLTWWGIPLLLGPIHDTMVMHHVLDELSRHGLKLLVSIYQPRYADYEKDLPKGVAYQDQDLDLLCTYAALDSDLTFRLYWQFTELLLEDERLYILFRNLLAASTPALFAMEQRGMLVDKEHLLDSIEKVKKLIGQMEDEMIESHHVDDFTQHRLRKVTEEYVNDLKERLEKREARLEATRENNISKLEERILKARSKKFKTDKAAENNEAKVTLLEKDLVTLRETMVSDATTQEWKDIIWDWENSTPGEYYPPAVIDHPEKYEVNFGSPAQMTELLFGRVGFKFPIPNDQYDRPQRDSAKGTLELLKDKSGFVDNLMALRQLKKILSTYLVAILNRLDDKHRVHGTFNQIGTATGRLSSSDPNMQNIIKRTKYKKVEEAVAMVMKCFVPPQGMKIMQADYSQAELRLMAFFSKDENMLQSYAAGEDLHAVTAATTMGMTLEEFKKQPEKEFKLRRYEAKSTNFGFIYKITPEGFMEYCRTVYGIKINLKQSRLRQKTFFAKYPGVLRYHAESIAKAKKYGYVRTLFGRRIRLPDIYSQESAKQGHAERNAINGRIQGTAGEMMVFAIALLYQRAPWLEICNTVHDSLMNYTPPRPDREITIIKETMENLPIKEYFDKEIDTVDMAVDFEASKSSWGELKEI